MNKIFFYKTQNIKNNFYCKWIFDLDKIDKFKDKNLLSYKDKKFKKKLNLTKKYSSFLFNILYKKLNKIHKDSLSEREWKILLGRWIKFYVDANYFRYDYLKNNIYKSKIENFYFKFNNNTKNVPNTLSDYIENIDSEERNNYLSWKILNYIKKDYPKKKINIFHKESNEKLSFDRFNRIYDLKGLKFKIANFLNFFLKFFLNKNSPIIVTSYLPQKIEYSLQIKNNSFFFWKHFFYKKNFELSSIFRKKKINRKRIYTGRKFRGFKGLLLYLLDDYFPTCFLENYNQMNIYVKKHMLVKKPKFIFTSNEFVYNEFFKYYLILALKNKSKYIVGQHGSAYGCLLDQFETTEEQTSDYFLTWGWKYNQNHIPVGMFNQIGKKKFLKNNKNISIKNLLLINTNYPHKKNFWDINEQYLSNFDQQLYFLKNLKFSSFKNVTIRFHHADKKYSNFFYSKYNSINKKLIIDNGEKKLEDYLDNETLVIFSYLSSGFFELFSRNFNCFSFDNLKKEHYVPKFYKELNKLSKNKIFFEDGLSASSHINKIVKEMSIKNSNNKQFNNNNFSFIKKYARSKNLNLDLIDRKINK